MSKTLLVAFYGGPGTGKSTTAALTFGALKQRGRNVELVGECAKDFTWEGRDFALGHQPYIAGKQMRNYDRLEGKVEAILTDTSTLLSAVYLRPGSLSKAAEDAFTTFLVEDWRARNTLNIFLARDPSATYNPAGRSQTEDQAKVLDEVVFETVRAAGVPYQVVAVDRSPASTHVERIVNIVESRL